ncbi:MAG: NAD-dependent epimerase/dehydratase family protein [Nanoarchaeota archaeon]
MRKILVTGCLGQIGSELVPALRKKHGKENVLGLDIKAGPGIIKADACNMEELRAVITQHDVDIIYHLVAILSANGEHQPGLTWGTNMASLKHVLDLAVELKVKQVFWPSSIAAFGPGSPKNGTPQITAMDPSTMYGATKVAGELLCNYYYAKFGLDVRSVRYPGLISYKTAPGGGTTDYAIEMFHHAIQGKPYACFVREGTTLPFMYMDDAIRATLEIMAAEKDAIKVRTSYNLAAVSFSARELAEEIRKHYPDFECTFQPDERQKIADSWPVKIDDTYARNHWQWKPEFTLPKIVEAMIEGVKGEHHA